MNDSVSTSEGVVKRGILGVQFWRLGWLGFWIQMTLLVVPIALSIYVFVTRLAQTEGALGVELSNYLSYGSLTVLAFTTFWFFRYTRLSGRIIDPKTSPPLASVERTLWVGVWASFLGAVLSAFLMFGAVGRMLFVLLATPQTGLQIAPTLADDPVKSLSAIDALSLVVLLVILLAELIVLALSLWLMFRTTRLVVQEAERTA